MKRTEILKPLCILFFLLSLPARGWAADLYVSPSASVTGACTQTDPCAFQTALNTAAANSQADTIHVLAGTYDIGTTLTYTPASSENFRLTIQGEANAVLNGNNSVQIMNIDTSGITDNLASVEIHNLTFQNASNNSGNGGGLYIKKETGYIELNSLTFLYNVAKYGSGALISTTGNTQVRIYNSRFENNGDPGITSDGGGLWVNTSSNYIDVIECLFINNKAGGLGGGAKVTTDSGYINVDSSIFEGNSSGSGGGLYAGSTLNNTHITNNMFITNSAVEGGGAFLFASADNRRVVLEFNTFFNNQASALGGGVNVSYLADTTTFYCLNNIFWQDTSKYGSDIHVVTDFDNNSTAAIVIVNNNDFADLYVTDSSNLSKANNINTNPIFVDQANGDFHLAPTSPCIDSGTATIPVYPTYDFERDNRVIDGNGDTIALPDMGADEYQPSQQASPTTVPTMNEWGLIIFIILAGLTGASFLKRRQEV